MLLTLSAVVMLGATPTYAYSDSAFSVLDFQEIEGFVTLLTDTQGVEHRYDGALDAASLERCPESEAVASYALLYRDEELLSVTLHDFEWETTSSGSYYAAAGTQLVNGYYSVDFALSDGSAVFLTGLTQDN